ncbi:MAG: UTRA domain-containing protein [Proteobacteria bacterium]|nr:UTRA domain-containing protein [Pseudomonadota bacterium]MBI3497612.1 UTRA domain-containing protein [Pseudomonadota bacterium]
MSGAWQPGHRVPAEHELLEQYSCSRMTVSKALSALAAAGLIIRKRRSGSFVASRVSEETVLEIHDTKAEILASGKPYSYEILSRRLRSATRKDVRRFGVPTKTRVLALLVRHFSGDQPFVIEDRIFNLTVVPDAAQEQFKHTPPSSWLLKRIPWTNTEHAIWATPASGNMASRLGIANGTACLVVERKTWQLGAPVTFVRLTYPGKLHRLIGRFRPASS